jgi:hypothetical protein
MSAARQRRSPFLWLGTALLLAGCAPGLLPNIPFLTSAEAAERRRANWELRRAELHMLETYRARREFSELYNKPACDEATGEDCFQGEYECPHCLWNEDRSQLITLGLLYDTVALRLADPPPGTSVYRLNWLAGQRVGLWTRQGQLDRAWAAADQCRAELWWCESLRGLVRQRAGDYQAAGRHFDRALDLMPPMRACYWQEVALYADSNAASMGHDGYGRQMRELRTSPTHQCPEQGDIDTFWTLADPLWSVPGNARRAEHFARLTDLQVHHQFLESMDPHGTHLLDHHTVVLRHGWPRGFDWRGDPVAIVRNRPSPMPPRRTSGGEAIHSITPPADPWQAPPRMRLLYGRGQQFTVAADLDDALRAGPDVFAPGDATGGESYEPPFGPVAPMDLQSGFFRHNGRPILAVRSAVPAAQRPAPDAWHVISWDGAAFRQAEVRVAGDSITAIMASPWEAQVVSLEAVHAEGAWRGRSGTRPPDALDDVAISSVILVDDDDGEPGSLEAALFRMLPATRIPAGTRAGAYWELYAGRPVSAAVDVTVRRTERPGLLSRIAGARPLELRVRWEEIMEPRDGVTNRTFDLDPEPWLRTECGPGLAPRRAGAADPPKWIAKYADWRTNCEFPPLQAPLARQIRQTAAFRETRWRTSRDVSATRAGPEAVWRPPDPGDSALVRNPCRRRFSGPPILRRSPTSSHESLTPPPRQLHLAGDSRNGV